MTVEISARDLNGKPIRVHEDNGFVEISRPYDAKTDGWIDDQLDPADFPAIQIGRATEYLINQVNRLKRENYQLKDEVDMWRKASGVFGA